MPRSRGIGWRELARRLAPRLPGAISFRGGFVKPRKVQIDAFYRGDVPKRHELEITIRRTPIVVVVRTHAAAPLPELVPPGSIGLTSAVGGAAFTGVHPGAAIAIELSDGSTELGAICALLAPAEDDYQPTHLITCGHIFEPKSKATEVYGGDGAGPPVVIGTLVKNLLDRAGNPRDVALVELTADGAAIALAGGPGPKLVGCYDAALIFNRNCRTYRPTIGDSSRDTRSGSGTINVHVDSSIWPGGFSVEEVIATSARVSDFGDSGTILASTQDIAIGSCTGSDPAKSFFEPLGRALDEIPKALTVWRNP